MKKRDRQRLNRKMKEEMLDARNLYGKRDPTPYNAVKNIIHENYKKQLKSLKSNNK